MALYNPTSFCNPPPPPSVSLSTPPKCFQKRSTKVHRVLAGPSFESPVFLRAPKVAYVTPCHRKKKHRVFQTPFENANRSLRKTKSQTKNSNRKCKSKMRNAKAQPHTLLTLGGGFKNAGGGGVCTPRTAAKNMPHKFQAVCKKRRGAALQRLKFIFSRRRGNGRSILGQLR